MTNTIRKHIWPVPLVASIVIIGALAAFLVLLNNPGAAMAQDPGEPMPSGDPCASMTDDERADHLLGGGTCAAPEPAPTPAVSAPKSFSAEALDNGARLSWEAPGDLPDNATVANYQVDRKVYHSDSSNPILENTGDAMIDVGVADGVTQETWDLGLSYGTTYTYRVRAHVSLTDDAGETTAEYGKWSEAETIITANSGGRLDPLLDPPTAPLNLTANASCDQQIDVTWDPPSDFGKVPANFPGCSTCTNQTPTHTGGSNAGIVILPGTAQIDGYMVERKIDNGAWQTLASNVTSQRYEDKSDAVQYGNTYTYRIRAMNNARLYGPWTTVSWSLKDKPAAPDIPDDLKVNLEPNLKSSELQWTPPERGSDGLWRTEADFEAAKAAGDYRSTNLSYHVERRIGVDGDWNTILNRRDAAGNLEPGVRQIEGGLYVMRHLYSRDGLGTRNEQEFIDAEPLRGANIYYRVSALVDGCNPSSWREASEVEIPPAVVPGTPIDLTATAMSQSQIDLSWTAPSEDGGSDITGYEFAYSTDGSTWSDPAATDSMTTHSHTDLTAGTTYHYRVAAINEVGSSMTSETAMATTTAVPGTPIDLTATAMSQSQIDLSWTAPSEDGGSDITGYEFAYSTDDGSTWSDPAATDSMTTHSHTDLTAGTTYHYRVAAINEVGSSMTSETAMATTAAVPGTPSDLTATAMSQSQIDLSWTASSEDGGSDITGYTFEYSTDDGSTWSDPAATDSMTTHSHTGLTAGTTYHYRVAAMNEVGSSMTSETAMATTTAVPGTPSDLTATAMSQSQIDLSWTASSEDGGSDITGYEFAYSTDDGSTWSDPAATDSMSTHSHTGLTAGTTYHYRVAAINEVGSSMTSEIAMATTAAAPIPSAPTITGVSSDAAGSATIMLTPGTNATVHYVWAAPVDGSEGMWSGDAGGNATSVTMTGLTSGQDYWFIAIAGNGADPTRWSGWSGWTPNPQSIQ